MLRPPLTQVGDLVKALVKNLNAPASSAAATLGLNRNHYQALLAGTLVVTHQLAQRLERLGYSTGLRNQLKTEDWLAIQQQYLQDERERYNTQPNPQPPTSPRGQTKWRKN